VKPFRYFAPLTLQEAFGLLSAYRGEAMLLAGGTDLLVEMKEKRVVSPYVIDLKRIPGLNQIVLEPRLLRIGALASIREVEVSPLVKAHAGLLADAAAVLGSLQVRNRGTIGGNLCHASPAADLAPPLIALEAKVKIQGPDAERMEDLEDFFTGSGCTALKVGEILAEVEIPLPGPRTCGTYLKFSPRKAMDLAVAGVAVVIALSWPDRVCAKARIALGAVAPTPIRARQAEKRLEGKKIDGSLLEEAARIAASEARPISDLRGSAWFRQEMVKVLVKQAVEQTLHRIQSRPGEVWS